MHEHGHDHPHDEHHSHGSAADGHRYACHHGSLAQHRDQADTICIDHLSFTYPQSHATGDMPPKPALRDITLHVEAGCNLGIIGPNGAGKSTLIRILLGQLTGYDGNVQLAGMTPAKACHAGDIVGYVPQRHDVQWRFPLSGRQVVELGLTGKSSMLTGPKRADRDYARSMIERVGAKPYADQPIGQLSGGQQQRLFIARALAPRPRILLLDEPFVGVDEAGQQQFADLIHELHEQLDLTLVIVSHDIAAIAAGCNRVACLKQSLHYHDAPEGLTREVLAEVFEHEITPISRRGEGG